MRLHLGITGEPVLDSLSGCTACSNPRQPLRVRLQGGGSRPRRPQRESFHHPVFPRPLAVRMGCSAAAHQVSMIAGFSS